VTAQPPLHERTGELRQPTSVAVRVTRMVGAFLAGNRRSLIISTAAAVFMGLAAPFDTGHAPLGPRLAYWLVAMLGGTVVGQVVADLFRARGWLEERPFLQAAAMTIVLSVPVTLLVWPLTLLVFGVHPGTTRLIYLFPVVLLVCAVMVAINVLASRHPVVTHAAPVGEKPAPFLDRLPPKLRGAELWAVEAEDHYLRLHTSRGQDLILMRLSDAVAELEGLEGAQTHRSWWVAKAAVTAAKRGDGRATLTLKDGAEAPVSRAYAKALREAGWY
jgi:hypothetical protein